MSCFHHGYLFRLGWVAADFSIWLGVVVVVALAFLLVAFLVRSK